MISILKLTLVTIMATTRAYSSITVVESLIRSKAGDSMDACEDDFVVTSNYACVVDGATSPTGQKWTVNQLTGGKWAAGVLCNAVRNELKPDMTACEIVSTLTKSLHNAYQQEEGALEIMARHPEERATASLVLHSKSLRQVIIVGDCQAALLDGKGEIVQRIQPDRYVDKVTSQARAMFWQAELLSDGDSIVLDASDPGRDLIQPLLVRQRRFQNNMNAPALYRYWAMDGFPIDEKEGVQVYDVPGNVKEIVLASDGYPKLFSTLSETEEHLHSLIRSDPMLVDQYVSTKGVRQGAESFDDRTYLRIRIASDNDVYEKDE